VAVYKAGDKDSARAALEAWNKDHPESEMTDAEIDEIVNEIGAPHIDDPNATTDAMAIPMWASKWVGEWICDEYVSTLTCELTHVLILLPDDASSGVLTHEDTHATDAERLHAEGKYRTVVKAAKGSSAEELRKRQEEALKELKARWRKEERELEKLRHDQEGVGAHKRGWERLEHERLVKEWEKQVDEWLDWVDRR
jgi:hypothetical protein